MAREPVAIDFVGVGGEGGMAATRLVKPVPKLSAVPEYHEAAATTSAAMGSSNFRNWTENVSPFARPSGGGAAGLSQPPWVNKHAMAMRQLQGQSSGLTTGEVVSDGTCSAVRRDPQQESSVSASPSSHHTTVSSSNRFEVFAQKLAQQARKAASMYANPPQQRNVASMRAPSSDETRASISGAEPSHVSSSTQTTAFGSPVPFYSTMKPENRQQQEEVNMVPAHVFERLPISGGKQPQTAQLTIFYAGTVNVYDKVPLDKAQAIMLLAGQGSSMSSHVDSRLPTPAAQPKVSQSSQEATTTSVGPPSAATTISNRPAPTITGVELPQARKASLARFLERRKDRVRKGPYPNRNQELAAQEARTRLNHLSMPSPSSPPTRPPNSSNQALIGVASSSRTASEPHSPSLRRERSISQERGSEMAPLSPSMTTTSGGKVTTEHHPS